MDIIDIDGPHAYTDPRLLTGQARIEEIGRLLALGILRLYKRQQAACSSTHKPRCSMGSRFDLSPKSNSRKIKRRNIKNSLDMTPFRSEYPTRQTVN